MLDEVQVEVLLESRRRSLCWQGLASLLLGRYPCVVLVVKIRRWTWIVVKALATTVERNLVDDLIFSLPMSYLLSAPV